MSEKLNKLTHVAFMECVDYLRKNKEKYLAARPSNREGAEMLCKDLKREYMAPATFGTIREASGVVWQVKVSKSSNGVRSSYKAALKVVVKYLRDVYKDLKGQVPGDLQAVYDDLYNTPKEGS